ncbi:MAG: hypothetical protein MK213_00205 [Planctomycetes bacterium]|nr:hypothetical protein [Planctomycetota bacterium]
MGLFQRLMGASDDDGNAARSPEKARNSAASSADIRALTDEIRLLRESLGGAKMESNQSESSSRRRGNGRNRRGGGRGDGRSGGGRGDRRDSSPARRSLPKEPPDDAPVGPLVDYLKNCKVVVYEGQDDLARNEAFEHIARHIGQHFNLVGPFYEKMKRCVATGHGTRIDIENWSDHERSAAVQLGTMLHRHGLLKDFYYHRQPKKQLRVIPTKDGSTAQFLTGGWLEIYVAWMLSRRLRSKMSPAKFQVLFNVKGTLPDMREFEADLMACVDGRMLWVECKTGHWQDYSARFKGLVSVFGTDATSAGLLLLRPPDASTRKRATSMLDMTLLSLDEVSPFFNRFLGIKEDEVPERNSTEEDRTAPLPLGVVPPLKEEEIPLSNAAPAKKLGSIDLDGPMDDAQDLPRRRRRRGRRGGRGRRPAASAESLHEPLELKSSEAPGGEGTPAEEAPKSSTADSKSAKSPFAESSEEDAAPKRRRRRRPASSKDSASEDTAKEPVEEPSSKSEPKADSKSEAESSSPKPKRKVAAKKPEPAPKEKKPAAPVQSAAGKTIAPDLAAMMAKPKD